MLPKYHTPEIGLLARCVRDDNEAPQRDARPEDPLNSSIGRGDPMHISPKLDTLLLNNPVAASLKASGRMEERNELDADMQEAPDTHSNVGANIMILSATSSSTLARGAIIYLQQL